MGGDTRVLLVGGHPVILGVVRLAVASREALDVVGEVGTASAVGAAVEELRPDAVVIDLELPDDDGLRLLPDLAADRCVIAVSDRSDGPTVLRALRDGVDGYLVKPDGLRAAGDAVVRARGGERVLDPSLDDQVVREFGRYVRNARESARLAGTVTEREREILALLAEGMTMRQVGRRLGISPRTVESHVGKLYRKLGVGSRVQAVARGAAYGLIDLE